ncbi:MAG: radical SAM protein [Planctomycetes bacterium]|nr:radical SAM protein [Planctomycetota bacterium]
MTFACCFFFSLLRFASARLGAGNEVWRMMDDGAISGSGNRSRAAPRREVERRVSLSAECNLACGYCAWAEAAVPIEGLGAALAAMGAASGDVVVLTGGEPALNRRLFEAISAVRRAGYEKVAIETNGSLAVYAAFLRALERAAPCLVRVSLPHAQPESYGRLARHAEGAARALEGVAALLDSPRLEVLARVTLYEGNVGELPHIFRFVAGRRALRSVEIALVESDEPRFAPSLDGLLNALEAALPAAGEAGVPARLVNFPACVAHALPEQRFEGVMEVGQRAGHEKAAFCGECDAAPGCAGFPRGALRRWEGEAAFGRRVAPQRGTAFQASGLEPDLVCVESEAGGAGAGAGAEIVVRVNWHCNERCGFCWLDLARPTDHEAVVGTLRKLLGPPAPARLSFSGGEPTLNPRLLEYCAMAREAGVAHLRLQTNAAAVDDSMARSLAAAGVRSALVALHAHTEELNHEVTRRRGMFARTVAGIHRLAAAGVEVELNHVMCRANYRALPEFARFALREFPGVPVSLTAAVPMNEAFDAREWCVPFPALAPPLRAALDQMRAAGHPFNLTTGTCGLPPCVVDGDPRYLPSRETVPRSPVMNIDFARLPACGDCSWNDLCPGVRRRYLRAFGEAGIRAIPFPAASARAPLPIAAGAARGGGAV